METTFGASNFTCLANPRLSIPLPRFLLDLSNPVLYRVFLFVSPSSLSRLVPIAFLIVCLFLFSLPFPVTPLFRMPSLLTGFIALLVAWLLQIQLVSAQDGDQNDGGQDWGNDPNNVTMCGISDFYNSTSIPYSCESAWCMCRACWLTTNSQ